MATTTNPFLTPVSTPTGVPTKPAIPFRLNFNVPNLSSGNTGNSASTPSGTVSNPAPINNPTTSTAPMGLKAPNPAPTPATNTIASTKTTSTTPQKSIYRIGGDIYDAATNQKIPNVQTLNTQYAGAKEVAAPNNPIANSNPLKSGPMNANGTAGAVVQNGNTGNTTPAPVDSSYGGIIKGILGAGNNQNPAIQNAQTGLTGLAGTNPATSGPLVDNYNKAVQNLADLKSKMAEQFGNIETSVIPLEFQQGREQALNRQYAAQLDAAQQAVNQAQAAITQNIQGAQTQMTGYNEAGGLGMQAQGLLQSALGTAGSLAAPIQAPYSNQLINPANPQAGNLLGGGTGGSAMSQLPSQAQAAIQSYAQQIQNGSMTRADAESRLAAYGIAGTNALNEVLGPNFNTNASNASAGTTAIGQQLSAAILPANQALDALQTAYNNLPGIERTKIPFVNGILQAGSMQTGWGRDQVSAFQGALQEARTRINSALQSGGLGVDAAGAQVNLLLPNDMVPSELPNKIAAAKMYLQNQLKSYNKSGASGFNSSTSDTGGGNTQSGTTSSGVGYTITQK